MNTPNLQKSIQAKPKGHAEEVKGPDRSTWPDMPRPGIAQEVSKGPRHQSHQDMGKLAPQKKGRVPSNKTAPVLTRPPNRRSSQGSRDTWRSYL